MASSLFSLRTSPSCRAGGIHSHLSQALFHYDSSSFSCNIPTYISSSLLLLTEKWTSTAGSSGYSRQSHVLANYPNKGYVVRQKERACQTLWLGTVRYIERPILPRRRRGDFWQLLALGVGFHKLRTVSSRGGQQDQEPLLEACFYLTREEEITQAARQVFQHEC